jgi:predicted enzyme related to lactoylglutathione lyase
MASASGVGRFVWYDLMTPDVDASKAFYTKVIGWGTSAFEIEGRPPYTMWTAGATAIGGIVPFQPHMQGMPAHWLSYVSVADVDASAARVAKLGGKVHQPPTDIPTVGRFAVIEDPQGGVIAIFRPMEGPQPGAFAPGTMEFSWHELATTDWRAGFDFYQQMFGWEKVSENDMGSLGVYLIFGSGGASYGGMFTKPPEVPVTAWCYYVLVRDVNEAVRRVTQNGGRVVNGPMEVPGGDWIAQCLDPAGGMFAVHHRTAG